MSCSRIKTLPSSDTNSTGVFLISIPKKIVIIFMEYEYSVPIGKPTLASMRENVLCGHDF
jgi:hypothetical protein